MAARQVRAPKLGTQLQLTNGPHWPTMTPSSQVMDDVWWLIFHLNGCCCCCCCCCWAAFSTAHAFVPTWRPFHAVHSPFHARPLCCKLDTAIFHQGILSVIQSVYHCWITPTLRDDLHWLPVPERIVFKLCLIIFKCRHQTAPEYPQELCVPS